jgi:threonine dehydratase
VITIADVEAAAQRLQGVALRTPVNRLEAFGSHLMCKLENRQVTGSFKIRGAYNCASQLPDDQLAKGLVAISSGNHAQAVAKSAQLLGTTALIAMPEDSSVYKLEATRALRAEVVLFDRFARDRDEVLRELLATSDRAFIPPYDHPHVMAGQGTVVLELLEDVPDIDVVLVPMSGGGLMAGCATVAKARNPTTRVIGVEPATANDTQLSFAKGERVWIDAPVTIADGLRVQTPGELTFEINRRLVDDVVTVTDDEIRGAMAFLRDELDETVEPSGAVGIAALQTERVDAGGQRAAVVISGGNIS